MTTDSLPTAAEIEEELAFLAAATARQDLDYLGWYGIAQRLKHYSDMRGATDEQWARFSHYGDIIEKRLAELDPD